jgi:hypothetical protein
VKSPQATELAQKGEELLLKTAHTSAKTGLQLAKRLYNGVADVVKMFLPGQLGKTIKNTLMGTAGLSAFSFVLTGPFHLPALPLFALASLGFDMAGTFINGLFRDPGHTPQKADTIVDKLFSQTA